VRKKKGCPRQGVKKKPEYYNAIGSGCFEYGFECHIIARLFDTKI
jgi:hypothetical protein